MWYFFSILATLLAFALGYFVALKLTYLQRMESMDKEKEILSAIIDRYETTIRENNQFMDEWRKG